MRIEFRRKTVKETVAFEGVGIHSGIPSKVVVHPGQNEIVFVGGGERIEAVPENVIDSNRCTALSNARTIEHLMSALAALEITDADIEVTGEELPILDGSASEFVEGLNAVGFEELGLKSAAGLFGRINMQDELQRMSISVGEGWWKYEFDTGERWPGRLEFEIEIGTESYLNEIATARTFVMEEEIDALVAAGLGKGANEHNTLVLGKSGYKNPSRFSDEPARHKLLDCIGDLYLAGIPPRFLNVAAERSGHKLNVRAAHRLQELCDWED
jgi:UDP-3-O-acyl-N-acetylglucosamine deacetylase